MQGELSVRYLVNYKRTEKRFNKITRSFNNNKIADKDTIRRKPCLIRKDMHF